MQKEKVLIVVSNLKIAGAQKMVEQLALAMDKNHYQLNIVCLSAPCDSFIEKRLLENGINLIFLNKKPGFQIKMLFQISSIVKKIKPSIIHTHVSTWVYTFPIAIRENICILHTIHSRPNRQESNSIVRKLITFLYHHHFIVPVAISNEIKKEAEELYCLSDTEVEMVVNPVDYVSFSRVEKIDHDNVVFVNVARFDEVKNQMFLINSFAKAYKKNQHIRLILAGDGKLMEEAKKLTKSLGIDNVVQFLGNVDNVPELFSMCDVFVLPSLTEGLPVSMLEAEAAGLPVIASKIGGIPDIFKDNGYLINVNDEKALIESILLLTNIEIREEKSKNSKIIAKQYSADKVARRYEELYTKYGRGK